MAVACALHRGSDVEGGAVDDPDKICANVQDVYVSHVVACQGTTCKSVSSILRLQLVIL